MEKQKVDINAIKHLAEQYKMICKSIENAEIAKERIKQQIISFLGEQEEFKGFGLEVTKVHPEPKVDWRAAQVYFRLTDDKLKPFLKERNAYVKISVQREIVTTQDLINQIWP